MSRPPLLTRDQLLQYAGQNSAVIAEAFGVHRSTVSKTIRDLGLQSRFPGHGQHGTQYDKVKVVPLRTCACGETIPRDKGMTPYQYAERKTCCRPECTAARRRENMEQAREKRKPRKPMKVKAAPLPAPLFMDPEHDRRLRIYRQMMGR